MMKGAHWRHRPETGIPCGAVETIYERRRLGRGDGTSANKSASVADAGNVDRETPQAEEGDGPSQIALGKEGQHNSGSTSG